MDARELEGQPTGVGRVLAGLLGAWPAPDEIVLLCRQPPRLPASLPHGWELRVDPGARRMPGALWEQLRLPSMLRGARTSVLLAPAYGMPLRSPCPVVVGMHDCSWEALPETFRARERWRRRAGARIAARRAAFLFMGSEFAAAEARRYLGVEAARTVVLPYGVEPRFRPASSDAIDEVRARYRMPDRAVLFVGAQLRRRAAAPLVAAIGELSRARPELRLCLIGGAPAAAELAGGDATVRALGYVEDTDLPALYSAASVVAYPSRYEGFGLPVLEALACGTPVVTSAVGALAEIYRGRAWLVEPQDHGGWHDALARLLDDAAERRRWVDAGGPWARARDWSEPAIRVRELLARAAGEPR